jgi:hypothetical protein
METAPKAKKRVYGLNIKESNDKWKTPFYLYQKLNQEFLFDDFDPCPLDWKEGDPDGLIIEWAATTFVNPPFSGLENWLKKAHNEWLKGKTIVMIIPPKTHLQSFHDVVLKNPVEIRFIKGKINFEQEGRAVSVNPYASILLIWRKERLLQKNVLDLTFRSQN